MLNKKFEFESIIWGIKLLGFITILCIILFMIISSSIKSPKLSALDSLKKEIVAIAKESKILFQSKNYKDLEEECSSDDDMFFQKYFIDTGLVHSKMPAFGGEYNYFEMSPSGNIVINISLISLNKEQFKTIKNQNWEEILKEVNLKAVVIGTGSDSDVCSIKVLTDDDKSNKENDTEDDCEDNSGYSVSIELAI